MSIFSKIHGLILGTAPSTPPTNRRALYAKADGWYEKDVAGVERKLVAQTSGQTKVYRATLTGSNGAIATTSVAENGLSAAIVWTYTGEGAYLGTLADAFVADKTNIQVSVGDFVLPVTYRASANTVAIETYNPTTGAAADIIGTIDVQITVAP